MKKSYLTKFGTIFAVLILGVVLTTSNPINANANERNQSNQEILKEDSFEANSLPKLDNNNCKIVDASQNTAIDGNLVAFKFCEFVDKSGFGVIQLSKLANGTYIETYGDFMGSYAHEITDSANGHHWEIHLTKEFLQFACTVGAAITEIVGTVTGNKIISVIGIIIGVSCTLIDHGYWINVGIDPYKLLSYGNL